MSRGRKTTCPLTGNPVKRAAADALSDSVKEGFPTGMARPALRALANAGYTRLEQLAFVSERDLTKLHGMGPNAVVKLTDALRARGLAFKDQ